MSLITMEMLKVNYDPKISISMSQYAKAIVDTRNETISEVLEIILQERDITENVTHKTIENIISAVLSLQGGEQE